MLVGLTMSSIRVTSDNNFNIAGYLKSASELLMALENILFMLAIIYKRKHRKCFEKYNTYK